MLTSIANDEPTTGIPTTHTHNSVLASSELGSPVGPAILDRLQDWIRDNERHNDAREQRCAVPRWPQRQISGIALPGYFGVPQTG
jgi:hypothetical protein